MVSSLEPVRLPRCDDFGSVLISYAATTTGNMIAIENANDFEFYSANSAGGIQGNGYQCRNAGYENYLFRFQLCILMSTLLLLGRA